MRASTPPLVISASFTREGSSATLRLARRLSGPRPASSAVNVVLRSVRRPSRPSSLPRSTAVSRPSRTRYDGSSPATPSPASDRAPPVARSEASYDIRSPSSRSPASPPVTVTRPSRDESTVTRASAEREAPRIRAFPVRERVTGPAISGRPSNVPTSTASRLARRMTYDAVESNGRPSTSSSRRPPCSAPSPSSRSRPWSSRAWRSTRSMRRAP